MREKTTTMLETQFQRDVFQGLTDFPKHLSSQYFYDEKGDKLFQDIMDMPEYYLTDLEFEILDTNKREIIDLFVAGVTRFQLIELGAGDGKKTKILLRELSRRNIDFTYLPLDISQNALDLLEASIVVELPKVKIEKLQGTYVESLKKIQALPNTKKVILFLGSNIGNLLHPQAVTFLTGIQEVMEPNDLLFVGCDQKKNPQTILDAYNDASGLTAAFNKNVLARINRELGGDFDLEKFLHWEVYDPETGTAKSYLVATEAQRVRIAALDLEVQFKRWETIHTEISQKYDDEVVNWLAKKAGLDLAYEFASPESEYKNYVLKKI